MITRNDRKSKNRSEKVRTLKVSDTKNISCTRSSQLDPYLSLSHSRALVHHFTHANALAHNSLFPLTELQRKADEERKRKDEEQRKRIEEYIKLSQQTAPKPVEDLDETHEEVCEVKDAWYMCNSA